MPSPFRGAPSCRLVLGRWGPSERPAEIKVLDLMSSRLLTEAGPILGQTRKKWLLAYGATHLPALPGGPSLPHSQAHRPTSSSRSVLSGPGPSLTVMKTLLEQCSWLLRGRGVRDPF